MNDNRCYKYDLRSSSNRAEYKIIAKWIPKNSHVIDLGCGDGSLLLLLKKNGIIGEGIDVSESAVRATRKKGIKAKQGRIDISLEYKNQEFDYAICNVTLQMVMYPEALLLEMKRIAYKQIISFPNFAFILNRFDLLINGRMPRMMIPGYEWYSTGHIHQLSIGDFEDFCKKNNLKILDQNHIFPERFLFIPGRLLQVFPNLFASTAVFLLENKGN